MFTGEAHTSNWNSNQKLYFYLPTDRNDSFVFDPPTNQLPCKRVLSSELPNVSQCIEENCGIFFEFFL